MSYNVLVSPDAFDGLKQVDRDTLQKLLPCIFTSLTNLGNDPVRLGEKPLVPYPVAGQIFYFDCAAEGINHHLAAIFCYDDSETAIHILSVRYRRTVM